MGYSLVKYGLHGIAQTPSKSIPCLGIFVKMKARESRSAGGLKGLGGELRNKALAARKTFIPGIQMGTTGKNKDGSSRGGQRLLYGMILRNKLQAKTRVSK
jgi:hypothetical protein